MFRWHTCYINDLDSIDSHKLGLYIVAASWKSNVRWGNYHWYFPLVLWSAKDMHWNVNKSFKFQYAKSYYSVIPSTPIAVDTFFAISGLLVAYKMFELIKKYGHIQVSYDKLLPNFIKRWLTSFQKWKIGYFIIVLASVFTANTFVGRLCSCDSDTLSVFGIWSNLAIHVCRES